MSGLRYDEWIKARKILPRDPRVMQIAVKLQRSRLEAFGAVLSFWMWVDDFAELVISEEGPSDDAYLYTLPEMVDEFIGVAGFCQAMPDCWLRVEEGRIVLPNYSQHNGKNAKVRSSKSAMMASLRNGTGNTSNESVTEKLPDRVTKKERGGNDRFTQEQEQERTTFGSSKEREKEAVAALPSEQETLPSGAKNESKKRATRRRKSENKSGEAAPASPESGSAASGPDRRRDLTSVVQDVLDAYVVTFPEGGITSDGIRAGEPIPAFCLVEERIREGRTYEELVEAIRGVAGSEWHRSNGYTAVEMIFRSSENVAKYRDLFRKQRTEGGSARTAKADPFEEALNDPSLDRFFRPAERPEGGAL